MRAVSSEGSQGAPVFTDDRNNRWSIGSSVEAHWWEKMPDDDDGNPRNVEVSRGGEVTRIHLTNDCDSTRKLGEIDTAKFSTWRITVDFGVFGSSEFDPTQIVALVAEGGCCG